MLLKLTEIRIGKRIREDLGDIKGLAQSMDIIGQLNPILIDNNFNLISGERRFQAAKSLKWEVIEVKKYSDLTEEEKLVIEIEENIKRKDLTWPEQIKSTERLHNLQVSIHGGAKQHIGGGWSIRKTSEMLKEAEGKTIQDLKLAKAMIRDPELASKSTKKAAYSEFKKKEELHQRTVLALLSTQNAAKKPINRTILTEITEPTEAKNEFTINNVEAIHIDCLDFLPTMASNSIDCVFTDPPYGINYDETTADTRRSSWENLSPEDNTEIWETVIKPAMKECQRIIKPGCHGYMFCSGDMFLEVKRLLLECNFVVNGTPLIWYKPHVFFAHNPYKHYKYDYEMCVLFSKGERKDLLHPDWAVWSGRVSTKERTHPHKKPKELVKRWLSNCTIENELVLDPFSGSGVVGEACLELDRRCILLEKDLKWWSTGVENLKRTKEELI